MSEYTDTAACICMHVKILCSPSSDSGSTPDLIRATKQLAWKCRHNPDTKTADIGSSLI